MLRLRSCVISQLLSPPYTSPVSHIHRLLSATAPPASPSPPISPSQGFAVEDYLINTCGLTRGRARKASTKIADLKSPANPDAVLAFLAGLGLSSADVAAAVVKDPRLLCAAVERTLAPVVVGLTDLGLLRPEIARLVHLDPERFLCFDLERTVRPNVLFLRECGLCDRDIAKLCIEVKWMLTTEPDRVRAIVACAEGIGVPRCSGMFRQALQAVAFLSNEEIAAKVDYLKKTFRWSDEEASIAVTKSPLLLRRSEDMLRRSSEFLISEVGLEPAYIAHRPEMLCHSVEGRLRPRYYVLKFLTENGLLDPSMDFSDAVEKNNDVFMEMYICPYKEVAPRLAEDYAAACRGEVPANFEFHSA